MGRQLVAYYSRRGQNFVGGELRDLAVGNTEIAAEMVQVLTQADIYRCGNTPQITAAASTRPVRI